jgi:hypothetical protein
MTGRARIEWWFSALCAIPWLLLVGVYAEACVARLVLSRWPRPMFDDPGIPFVMFLAGGFLLVLSLFPGKAMVMSPYAVTLERGRGIWVCGPPNVWIPLDEITDVATYTTWLGRSYVIKLRQPHGLVKRVFLYALVSPDELANQLRSSLDCPNGTQPAKQPRIAPE